MSNPRTSPRIALYQKRLERLPPAVPIIEAPAEAPPTAALSTPKTPRAPPLTPNRTNTGSFLDFLRSTDFDAHITDPLSGAAPLSRRNSLAILVPPSAPAPASSILQSPGGNDNRAIRQPQSQTPRRHRYMTPVTVRERRLWSSLRKGESGISASEESSPKTSLPPATPPRLKPCDYSLRSEKSPLRKLDGLEARGFTLDIIPDSKLQDLTAADLDKLDMSVMAPGDEDKMSMRQVRNKVFVIFQHLDPDKKGYVWFDDWKEVITTLDQTSKYGLHCNEAQAKELIELVRPDGVGIFSYGGLISVIAEKFYAFQEGNQQPGNEYRLFQASLKSAAIATKTNDAKVEIREEIQLQASQSSSIEAFIYMMKNASDESRLYGFSRNQFVQTLVQSCIDLDDENTGKLDRICMRKAISQTGMGISQREISLICAQAPVDGNGMVDYRAYLQESFDLVQTSVSKRFQQLSSDVHFTRYVVLKAFQQYMKNRVETMDWSYDLVGVFGQAELAKQTKEPGFIVLHNEILAVLKSADLCLSSSQIHLLARVANPDKFGGIDYREFCEVAVPLLFAFYSNRHGKQKLQYYAY